MPGFTVSQSLLKFISIESVMPSNHLILYCLLLLPPSLFPSMVKVKVAQSCPTLCDPTDYTVHGILQAWILEWVSVPFSRGSSRPRDWTQVSHIVGGFFTSWAVREALLSLEGNKCGVLKRDFFSSRLENCAFSRLDMLPYSFCLYKWRGSTP